MKALDERLKKSSEPLTWPSLDDPSSSSQDELAASPTDVDQPQLETVVVVGKDQTKVDTNSSPNLLQQTSPKTETA